MIKIEDIAADYGAENCHCTEGEYCYANDLARAFKKGFRVCWQHREQEIDTVYTELQLLKEKLSDES